MKKILLLIIINIFIQDIYAQVGINTENPKKLLHIDGAATVATKNPATGNISALQASDDVVITNDGNIGIGILDPEAKVDILSSSSGALKISDTTEGVGKVLISDANGTGRWSSISGSWYAILSGGGSNSYSGAFIQRPIGSYTTTVISSPVDGGVDQANGVIAVPYNGTYRVTISGHWATNRLGAEGSYRIIPMGFINGILRWQGLAIGYAPGAGISWGLSSVFIFNISLNAGDHVTVYMDERFNDTSNYLVRCMLCVEFMN